MSGFQRIKQFLKLQKKYTILAILAVFIETLFELVIPMITSQMLDNGVAKYVLSRTDDSVDQNLAIRYIIICSISILVCALMSLVCGWVYSFFAAKAASRFGKSLREAEFAKIQDYTFSNLDLFEPSSLVTRVINDSMVLQNTYQQTLRPLVRSPLMLILGIGFTLYYSWQLALVFFVLTPILAIVITLILRKIAPEYTFLQNKLDKLNGKIEENLTAIRAVKSFVREDYEAASFDIVNSNYKATVTRTYRLSNIILPFFQVMMYTSNIIFLLLGGNMIIHGKLTTGGLTAILSYVMQTFNSLIMLSNVFVTFAKAIASLTRINEVLNVCPDIVSGDVMSLDNASIEFNNVSFHYKQSNSAKDVLSNISFKLENGQTLGILGETGSAKSTLVSLIARLYDVTSGNIKIGDKDIKEYDLNVLRKNIGFVLQQANLFEGSLKENLCWARPDLTDEEISKALHDSCVDEFLDRLPNGLDTYIGEGGNTLSGGQKQRVSIARALLKNPRILILDDSTSAVDTQTEKKIRHALEKLPMTKIIISQRILSVMDADLVLILEGGKINEINTPQALLEHNHIYKDLFDRQLKGVDLNE